MAENERVERPEGSDSPQGADTVVATESPDDGDLQVVVEDAPAPEGQDGVAGGDDVEAPEPQPEDRRKQRPSARQRIRELTHEKRQYEAALSQAQQQIQAVQWERQQAIARAVHAERAGLDAHYGYLKSVEANLQAQKAQALNTGDAAAVARIDAEAARLGAAIYQTEGQRAQLQRMMPQPGQQQPVVQPPPQQRPQPVPQRLHPTAERWAEAQSDWLSSDQRKIRDARIEAQRLEADGYTPDDPEYYDQLNRRLSTLYNDFRPVNPAGSVRQNGSGNQRPGGSAVAPVDRGSNFAPQRPGQIRVTREELEGAKRLGINVDDPKALKRWASEKVAYEQAEANRAARRAR